jgi:hypothetical protein
MNSTLNAGEIEHQEKMYQKLEKYVLARASEIPAERAYHNKTHFKDSRDSATRIALVMGVNIWDRIYWMAKAGALMHDIGLVPDIAEMYPGKTHEEAGRLFALQILPYFGYNQLETESIANAVSSTPFPKQSPKNLIEQIVCDSDVDNFGRYDFFQRGKLLGKELRALGVPEKPENERNAGTLKLLEAHSYFTEGARKLRDSIKKENMEKLRRKLKAA